MFGCFEMGWFWKGVCVKMRLSSYFHKKNVCPAPIIKEKEIFFLAQYEGDDSALIQ